MQVGESDRAVRFSRRRFLRLIGYGVGVTAASGLAASCGGNSQGGNSQGGGQGQITFRQFDPAQNIKGLKKAIDKWNSGNPNTQVQLATMPQAQSRDQYVREVQQGTGPDIIQLGFVDIRPIAENGLLKDLGPFLKDSSWNIDDFRANEFAKANGKIYALPWTNDTFALVYRPDLLKKAGVSMERFPGTWSDFQNITQKLASSGGNGSGAGFCFPAGSGATGGGWFLYNYYLWSNGKFLVDKASNGKWEVGVTAKEVAKAIKYFNSFFTTGATSKNMIRINDWGDPALVGGLGRGDCAIGFMPPQTFRAAQAQSKSPLRTVAVPRGSEQSVSHLGGRGLGINPNTKHPKQVWEFLKYLNSENTFQTYEQYPALKSLFKKLKFPKAEQGYVEELPKAITFYKAGYVPSPASVPSMWEATNREFGAVFSGQKAPEQAGTDLVAQLKSLLQEGGQK